MPSSSRLLWGGRLIAREARQFGIKAPLLGGDGWVGESLLKVAGNALDGCFSQPLLAGRSLAGHPEFCEDLPGQYGKKPDAMAALGYDSAKSWPTRSPRGHHGRPEAPRRHCGTKDFKGVTGDITLDADRNATKAAVILTIANGASNSVQRVAP